MAWLTYESVFLLPPPSPPPIPGFPLRSPLDSCFLIFFQLPRVLPLSRSAVGVRACRALSDGRLISVNGLGVLEQFEYSWREWQESMNDATAAAAGGGTREWLEGDQREAAGEGDKEKQSVKEPQERKRCVFLVADVCIAVVVVVISGIAVAW